LFAFAGSIVGPIALAAQHGFDVESNSNRPGKDYRNFDLAKPDYRQCQSACDQDPKCRAFTYVKPGKQGASARCWLKSAAPKARKDDCCISGVKGSSTAASRDTNRVERRATSESASRGTAADIPGITMLPSSQHSTTGGTPGLHLTGLRVDPLRIATAGQSEVRFHVQNNRKATARALSYGIYLVLRRNKTPREYKLLGRGIMAVPPHEGQTVAETVTLPYDVGDLSDRPKIYVLLSTSEQSARLNQRNPGQFTDEFGIYESVDVELYRGPIPELELTELEMHPTVDASGGLTFYVRAHIKNIGDLQSPSQALTFARYESDLSETASDFKHSCLDSGLPPLSRQLRTEEKEFRTSALAAGATMEKRVDFSAVSPRSVTGVSVLVDKTVPQQDRSRHTPYVDRLELCFMTTGNLPAESSPPGSYLRTCRDAVIIKGTRPAPVVSAQGQPITGRKPIRILRATCMNLNREWRPADLEGYETCQGDIRNLDGQLRCVVDRFPPGSYLETCRNVRASQGVLSAECRRRDGDRQNSELSNFNECLGDISNNNGRLHCHRVSSEASFFD